MSVWMFFFFFLCRNERILCSRIMPVRFFFICMNKNQNKKKEKELIRIYFHAFSIVLSEFWLGNRDKNVLISFFFWDRHGREIGGNLKISLKCENYLSIKATREIEIKLTSIDQINLKKPSRFFHSIQNQDGNMMLWP